MGGFGVVGRGCVGVGVVVEYVVCLVVECVGWVGLWDLYWCLNFGWVVGGGYC